MSGAANIPAADLDQRRCRIRDGDVVWLRAVLEAYDGLGYVYGDGTGVVLVTTTRARSRELDALLEDLRAETLFELL